MNPRRFPVTGRFAPKPLSERSPIEDYIRKYKSPAHLKAWQTREQARQDRVLAHIVAMQLDMAFSRNPLR